MPAPVSSLRSALVIVSALLTVTVLLESAQEGDWAAYGRDPGGERFSPLTSIRRAQLIRAFLPDVYHCCPAGSGKRDCRQRC